MTAQLVREEKVLTTNTTEDIVLTRKGHDHLEAELNRLITVERHEIAERIRESKDDGDLFENPTYDAAKNAQAFVEGRILELKEVLGAARILRDTEIPTDYVGIGSVVTVRDCEYDDMWTLTVVSSHEANPDEERISERAPIGQALLGHRVGETVLVKTPGGLTYYEICAIHA
jgi:transcription elongation factor GreA